MAKNESISVKDAVHKLQLSLFEGIKKEEQLFAAGSLISRYDYQDVVTERTIANMCGYPICKNPLLPEKPRKGRYRISLKEHKVYDLHETYMYCSTSCVVNSRTFAGCLQEERCSVLNSEKLDEIMGLFEGLSLDSKEDLGRNGDLGFSELKIQEKANVKAGEVSLEEWIGPSNAIEGYVPQKDRTSKPLRLKNHKEEYIAGSKPNDANSIKGKNVIFNEMDFKSTIITQDEYSISKMPSGSETTVAHAKSKELKEKGSHKKLENQFTILEIAPDPMQTDSRSMLKEPKEEENGIVTTDKLGISYVPSHPSESDLVKNAAEVKEEFDDVEADHFSATMPKPSLKSSGAKKLSRSVTWADERTDGADNRNLCEVRELENTKEDADKFSFPGRGDDDYSVRFASAEACVIALSQAAEAVSCGESDVSDAVSEAGIIILPPPHDMDIEEPQVNPNVLEPEPTPSKWPGKPGVPNYNLFDSEDSWYDGPPEEFSLTLSSFATMWMALFAWISSSSLAYIYGRDDSFHEEYLCVNGREYPRKIVLMDGRSSEIKQTLSGCLARALPGLVADLRLPTPISILEQGMGCLLDTMSFVDPLPPFRMKQWQVIVLLFIDALSVSRIPALTPHITSRRTLLYKVLNGTQISAEEYETMKDLIIPLGRVPEFSTQCGG
ncbi:putative RNA polymerase II subunit B1 CTD phosphatase RPAP2 homolog isoform X1 [Actinidia eriantha]|nr:putative RNA polymerase II subunit B1 CTD phosphatase RPAP2 homolog isoform X1 [Actinidia eriantha]XP_057464285.1 putative RNA polymerase II subunit B1 CTD phosphatase RPAP2 homolog isoform X1 [Actinidia eriantha]XP_057464286.1 putative RNA polymerase II subunit B1 CTD phosphatase RPAP2 homolog isoform X1 [Actinidia eriantha]XP_057464287.1 putative RNA polymerase II subunit B1 CTD phosphatase RPAP2 homolog isoform X1 [Actinidia eriantha]XP_057464288.1 putative RNA polymerase II subunit B1 CT